MPEMKGVPAFIAMSLLVLLLLFVVPFVVWLLGYWTLPFGTWTFQNLWDVMWVSILVYVVIFGLIGLWLWIRSLFQ